MPGLTRRKRSAVEEEESDGSQDVSEDETQQRLDGDSEAEQDNSTAALNAMVKSLVRLALAVEYQRRPLRRTEIGEKVLGTNGRQFRKVFAQAQQELRAVFGMELVELPVKEKVTVAQKRAAQQNEAGPKTVTSWILSSVLPSEYHDPAIIPPSAIPDSIQDSTYTAIYTMLVSLISLNRGSLPDVKMERFLTRMQLEDTTPVTTYEKPDKLIKRLERDGYIVRVKESIGTGDEEVTWVVGPRGKIEVGDAGVKGMVETVYGNPEDEEDAELARKIERSLGVGEKPVAVPTKKQKRTNAGSAAQRRQRNNDDDSEDD